MRTALRVALASAASVASLASLALWASLGTLGCTVTVNDGPLDDAGPDGSVFTDTGTPDTAVAETTADTGIATDVAVDSGAKTAVIVKASSLIGGVNDSFRDFGGGSTRLDIEVGGRLWNAVAKFAPTSGTPIESTVIGKDSTDTLIDGRLEGLPVGAEVTFTVTGYLRGLNGNAAEVPNTRIPWAQATCKATPSATADVIATCEKLEYIAGLQGIVFSSDVLPDGYCDGKGKTDFELLRVATPYTGAAVVSKSGNDCEGVIWVPLSEFQAQETNGVSSWSISAKAKSLATACTYASPGCVVDRKDPNPGDAGPSLLDIVVVGEGCRLSNANTASTCF